MDTNESNPLQSPVDLCEVGPVEVRLHDQIGPVVWERALAIVDGGERVHPPSIACVRVAANRIDLTRSSAHAPWTASICLRQIDGIDRTHIRAINRAVVMLAIMIL